MRQVTCYFIVVIPVRQPFVSTLLKLFVLITLDVGMCQLLRLDLLQRRGGVQRNDGRFPAFVWPNGSGFFISTSVETVDGLAIGLSWIALLLDTMKFQSSLLLDGIPRKSETGHRTRTYHASDFSSVFVILCTISTPQPRFTPAISVWMRCELCVIYMLLLSIWVPFHNFHSKRNRHRPPMVNAVDTIRTPYDVTDAASCLITSRAVI